MPSSSSVSIGTPTSPTRSGRNAKPASRTVWSRPSDPRGTQRRPCSCCRATGSWPPAPHVARTPLRLFSALLAASTGAHGMLSKLRAFTIFVSASAMSADNKPPLPPYTLDVVSFRFSSSGYSHKAKPYASTDFFSPLTCSVLYKSHVCVVGSNERHFRCPNLSCKQRDHRKFAPTSKNVQLSHHWDDGVRDPLLPLPVQQKVRGDRYVLRIDVDLISVHGPGYRRVVP